MTATANAQQVFCGPFFNALKPDQINMTVSEWADEFRVLTSESSAEPGRYETARTPYLREIMDSLGPQDPCHRVTFKKSSQVGATEAANNWVGYVIDQVPGPFLIVYPTDKVIEKINTQRFTPFFNSMPRLSEKIGKKKSQDKTNTKYIKEFPGGLLILGGANAPTNFNSYPIRFLLADEVDRFPMDCGGEGDPIELADGRTKTFSRNKKQFFISTPVDDDTSIISRLYNESDQRVYKVPCPNCGEFQKLIFERLQWTEGDYSSVVYVCSHCETGFPEQFKTEMLERGFWEPQNPSEKQHKGYHINALYSPLGWESWADIARKWDKIRETKDQDLLKVFVNTILGETWKSKGDTPEWETLYRNRETYKIGVVPRGAFLLTAGVDVQHDRLECEVVGWGRNQESWSVEYKVFKGDTTQPEVWQQFTRYSRKFFGGDDNLAMPISKIAIDSGNQTQIVYRYVKDHQDGRLMAVKGQDKGATILGRPRMVDIRDGETVLFYNALEFWPVCSSMIKLELFARLNLNPPASKKDLYPYGYCHFPDYDQEFFKQLTAETRIRMFKKGKVSFVWKQLRDRNESLDCRVYARAAANLAGIDDFSDADWEDIRLDLIDKQSKFSKNVNQVVDAIEIPGQAPVVIQRKKSDFWNT